ncbi:MAG: hypothetical protein IIT45_09175, partial [Treponema sp.]|nr:hypothetical protein [Treponema sp.]
AIPGKIQEGIFSRQARFRAMSLNVLRCSYEPHFLKECVRGGMFPSTGSGNGFFLPNKCQVGEFFLRQGTYFVLDKN